VKNSKLKGAPSGKKGKGEESKNGKTGRKGDRRVAIRMGGGDPEGAAGQKISKKGGTAREAFAGFGQSRMADASKGLRGTQESEGAGKSTPIPKKSLRVKRGELSLQTRSGETSRGATGEPRWKEGQIQGVKDDWIGEKQASRGPAGGKKVRGGEERVGGKGGDTR